MAANKKTSPSSQPAIDKLLTGLRQFKQHEYHEHKALFDDLSEHGQKPKILLVTCCDSRVRPAMLFNAAPGDFFEVRNVANVVPPHETNPMYHGTSAALQYGVCHLNVEHIVIMGHMQCGGIASLFDEEDICSVESEMDFIRPWMDILKRAKTSVEESIPDAPLSDKIRACEEQGIMTSLDNLMSYPWIASRVQSGQLQCHGWLYDFANGDVYAVDEQRKQFAKVE